MTSNEHFLVTGAMGCIGAWTVANLVRQGATVTATDLSDNPYRLRYLLDADELAQVEMVQGDIADLDALERLVAGRTISHIIHLAALQVPFCRGDPPLGARVNVTGTVNVFEVAKRQRDQVRQVVYASSSAVYGPKHLYGPGPVAPDALLAPGTHYGVYKQANEGTARIYWQDDGVASIGLRPYIVYGVGRDQGMTSGASKAMLAAAAGLGYHIPHGGRADFQWANDVALAFIACARASGEGARVYNVMGNGYDMGEIVAAIEAAAPEAAGKISYDAGVVLPFPDTLDDATLAALLGELPATPLAEAVRGTVDHFRRLIEAGQIDIAASLA